MDEDFVIEPEINEEGLQGKIKKIKEELKKCQKEKEEYLAGWQRAKADFINARKEHEGKTAELAKYAEERLVADLLPVLDAFDSCFKDENWQKLDKNWQEGVEYIYNEFLNILKKRNVTISESEGKMFDPSEHESIGAVDVGEAEKDNIVIKEVRKGYKINQKIIRPAQVRVGKYKSRNEERVTRNE